MATFEWKAADEIHAWGCCCAACGARHFLFRRVSTGRGRSEDQAARTTCGTGRANLFVEYAERAERDTEAQPRIDQQAGSRRRERVAQRRGVARRSRLFVGGAEENRE